jgi:L-iditol 2-dehydrogenase
MKGTMKVAVMTDLNKMELQRREIPSPKDGEVLVKVEYVGICGSDLHYFEKGRIGNFIVETPFVLGHESAGVVVEVGKGVNDFKVGDRVSLEPGKTCGHCEFCKTGRYNLCPDVIFFATPPVGGVFQEYVAHEASLCFKLPDNVSFLAGALIEPLSVGFHAANMGGAKVGQTAAIMGSGCIGLCSMLALKAFGISNVYVVDIIEKRLEKARELGATAAINAAKEDAVETIKRLTDGKGCDLVIEAAGTGVTVKNACEVAKKGGTIVLVAYHGKDSVAVPVDACMDKELTLKTIFRYRNIYPMAIDAVASGRVNVEGIVDTLYELDDIQRAMDESIHNKAEIVKSAVRIC